MKSWYFYAVGAALLYGAHQIFTKLASDRISDGLGGFAEEASAALTIFLFPRLLGWVRGGGIGGVNDSFVSRISALVRRVEPDRQRRGCLLFSHNRNLRGHRNH